MTTLANLITRDYGAPARAGGIETAQLRALLLADVRRLGPPVARSTAGVLAVVTIALVTGLGSRGLITGLVTALLVMQPMFLALQLVKDKLDGTLGFLCALPVSPGTLATVRVAPIVVLSILGGAATAAIALWHGLPEATGYGAVATAATALMLGTLVPAALASVVLALSARFRFETLVSLPMILMIGLLALGKAVERFVPASVVEQARTLLMKPWMPALLVAILGAALVAIVLLSHRVTARTFERFTPER